ncbi:MAG: 3-dehydroquinate synthase [Desulfobacterales bacterium]|nr:MAG: 3-dehydroquinate synthase [Desulfobacterales bacterium]
MKILEIFGSNGDSTLFVGERIQHLQKYIPGKKAIIITDINVKHFYEKEFPSYEVITIGTGEEIKTLDTARAIYKRLVELEADRSTFIIGIGGGIVCDIAGFVASTYLRGVKFGFVSTTLLSQVDASVGGKNGVNFEGYKNMVGVFNQPQFVICDPFLLHTLPQKEIRCGLAEIVKHAAIADANLFTFLEAHYQQAQSLDTDVIEKLVYDSVVIKSDIVNRDETEQGERRKLNFGHTFGHAIEKTTGVSHGEAISIGMVMASALSVKKEHLPVHDAQRIKHLLEKLGLPTTFETHRNNIIDAVHKDKKREGDRIHFVLLNGLGSAFVDNIPIKELTAAITYMS